MNKTKIYFLILLIIMLLFSINSVKAEEEIVSCSYSIKLGECDSNSDCKLIQDAKEEKIEDTFDVEIYMDRERYSDKHPPFPGFTIDSKLGGYGNNNTEDRFLRFGEGDFKEEASAVDYYTENKRCPEYFGISTKDQFGTELNGAPGSFISAAGYEDGKKYFEYIFPLEQAERDENLEKTDEEYSCNLYSTNALHPAYDIKVSIRFNATKQTLKFNMSTDESEEAQEAFEKYKDEYLKRINEKGEFFCPTEELKLCTTDNESYIYPKDFTVSEEYYLWYSTSCTTLSSKKETEIGETGCTFMIDMVRDLRKSTEEYYNKLSKIKSFCQPILKSSNYDNIKYSCMEMCLNLKDYLPNIKLPSSECGFSERLIYWIANIIRWVKYIVPVVVIILSILDFIKAMSSDKDDEMKKAQQRFIRRLIAAALIFIAPFIIEFILNKMGFTANGCGIINL